MRHLKIDKITTCFRLPCSLSESKNYIYICVIMIYLLGVFFTAPVRHGADRFYTLALDIIENRSFDIQRLIDENNHYAIVSPDIASYHGIRFCNTHPGQALWGLPGLTAYRIVHRLNNYSQIPLSHDASDKLDFYLSSFSMNLTSSAFFTAMAALMFIYLAARSLPIQKAKYLKIAAFMFFFYLGTPLFYYSTHIVQNQSESCLAFLALGILCISAVKRDAQSKYRLVLLSGVIIGMAILTNATSLLLLPFAVLFIMLDGFKQLRLPNKGLNSRQLFESVCSDWKHKAISTAFLCVGIFIPMLFLLYYQYSIFGNPFDSVEAHVLLGAPGYSPAISTYIKDFFQNLVQILFSPKVGLFAYTPLLALPVILVMIRPRKGAVTFNYQQTPEHDLREVLFKTMLIIIPIYIAIGAFLAARFQAGSGFQLYMYNLYSARYSLPVVFPLGYLLLESMQHLTETRPAGITLFRISLAIFWIYGLAVNIGATLIGDWIFGVSQIWDYGRQVVHLLSNHQMPSWRILVDW